MPAMSLARSRTSASFPRFIRKKRNITSRSLEPFSSALRYGRGNVAARATARDERRVLVDEAVVDTPGVVVARIAGTQHVKVVVAHHVMVTAGRVSIVSPA